MNSVQGILSQIEGLARLDTPEQVAGAIALLEKLTFLLPEPAKEIASLGLMIAHDQALAGNGPAEMTALRASIRGEWQAALDRLP